MRIGVFGGSFDPIHHGHLIAASALADALALDEIRLVVAREQPAKRNGHFAPAEARLRMVELAVGGDARLSPDGSEVAREGPSYTVDTLRALRRERPADELILLIGADAHAKLDGWREPAAIRALARVESFSRGSGTMGVEVPGVDISSTAIRSRVRAGQSIRYWVPDRVAEYIAAHGLYRGGADQRQ